MHRDAELKRLADARRFDARSDPAPESSVEQEHIRGGIERVRREFFEIHHDGVSRQRHSHFFAHATHAGHAKDWIFEIVITDVFDLLTKPDCRLSRPDTVWIEAKMIAGKVGSQRAITFQFVLWREYSAFQLVRAETVLRFQFARM